MTYVNPINPSQWQTARTDQGVDYLPLYPNTPVVAIGDATVVYSSTQSGWPGGAFLAYQLADGTQAGHYVYVAEHLTNLVPVGTRVAAGQTIALAQPGYPWTEWGWASGSSDGVLTPYGNAPDGTQTGGGKAFARFLVSLGAKVLDDPGPGPLYPGGPVGGGVSSTALLPANAQTVFNDLIAAGASAIQAAAIVGNMLQEDSQLNPETVAMDSNGAYSRGLVQWNDLGAGKGVNWSQYITGNVSNDIQSQVQLIKAQGGFADAIGTDPYSAGESFAQKFEACAECGPGGAQLAVRGQAATTVYQIAMSGNWNLGASQLAPYGQSLAGTAPVQSAATLDSSFLQLPADILNPTQIFGNLFSSGSKVLSGAEAAEKAAVSLVSLMMAPSTWIRTGEVILGTILGVAGAALFAIVLAEQHPGAVMDLAGLIPGEGQVARVATGAATSAARTGRATATVSGGVRARRATKATGATKRAPARVSASGGGQAARGGARTASGTARRAAGQSEWTRAARGRERNRRLARQWGPAAAGEEDQAADDWAEARERRARRENRSAYRKAMGPRSTSDLRRRTS